MSDTYNVTVNDKSLTWEDAVCWLRAQPDKQELVRSAYYDDPLMDAAERYWHSNEWAEIRKILVGRTGKALDIGAGRGIGSYALAKEGFAVAAIEPDTSDIVGSGAIRQLAQSNALDIEILETISETLPFADATFDFIYGRAVLHHIGDLPAAMKEFYRVLKPGGLFLGLREHVISRREDLQAFLDIHPLHHLYGGENAYLLEEYVNVIQSSGLQMVRVYRPLENAMNYAPFDEKSLYAEIANRFSAVPFLPAAISILLRAPMIGLLALKFVGSRDHRPGRHYSFLAQRVAD